MSDPDLILEPFADPHFPTLASWFASERDALQWGGPAVHYPLTTEQMQAMLSDHQVPPSRLAWMAVCDGADAGHAQVISVDQSARTARLGRIVVAPACRGQGLAVPMLRLVIHQTFAVLDIDRVDLGVYAWNVGAIKTYERLGFTATEIKPAATTSDGESWEVQEMSLRRVAHG